MKTIYILLLIFVLFGCSASQKLKQQQKLLQEQKEVKSLAALQQLYLTNRLLLQDSTQSAYRVEIWPIGKFSYSADSGFVGQAQQVLINGAITKKLKVLNETALMGQEVKIYRSKAEVKSLSNSLNKKVARSSTGKLLGPILLLVGLVVVYYFFRMRWW